MKKTSLFILLFSVLSCVKQKPLGDTSLAIDTEFVKIKRNLNSWDQIYRCFDDKFYFNDSIYDRSLIQLTIFCSFDTSFVINIPLCQSLSRDSVSIDIKYITPGWFNPAKTDSMGNTVLCRYNKSTILLNSIDYKTLIREINSLITYLNNSKNFKMYLPKYKYSGYISKSVLNHKTQCFGFSYASSGTTYKNVLDSIFQNLGLHIEIAE